MTAGAGVNTKLRLVGLDGLRGFLALCVILVHVTAHYSPSILAVTHVELLGQAIVVFFVMSGLLIYMPFARALITRGDPLKNLRRYTKSRILRVFPAYLAIFLIANAFSAVYVENAMVVQARGSAGGTGAITDPWSLLLHLLLVQNYLPSQLQTGINSSWTLTVELAFYLALPFISVAMAMIAARFLPRASGYVVAAIPGIALVVIGLVSRIVLAQAAATTDLTPEMTEWGPYPIAVLSRSILPWADNFGWGMLAVVFYIAIQRGEITAAAVIRIRKVLWPVGIGALALSGMFYFVEPRFIAAAFAVFSTALILLLIVPVDGSMRIWWAAPAIDNRVFFWVGTTSLSVYLWHYPVIIVLERWGWAGGDDWAGWAWSFFLVTVVSVSLATLTYLFIERPAMQWASGRKR